MPAKSKAQQHLMAAAMHGADFPMAKKVRASMTPKQMGEFASGSMAKKPAHVKPKPETESYAYDFRKRNNLKRGTGY